MKDTIKTRLAKRRGGLNGKTEAKIRGGQLGGKKASPEGLKGKVRAGHISNAKLTHAHLVLGGQVACHVRYHVNRGIVTDKCKICQADPPWEPSKLRKARRSADKVRKIAAIRADRAKHLETKSISDPPQPAISNEELKAAREVCGLFIRDNRLSVIGQELNCTWAKAVAIRRALVSFCQ